MSSMRKNIDFGPVVLPFGGLSDSYQSFANAKALAEDWERLQQVLSADKARHPNDVPKFQAIENNRENDTAVTPDANAQQKILSDIKNLSEIVKNGSAAEVKLKVNSELMPDTWLVVKKTAHGIDVFFSTTSKKTKEWLESVSTSLATTLKSKLGCDVLVQVCCELSPMAEDFTGMRNKAAYP